MAGSKVLTRKQLEKMSNNQLIDFAMKLQEKLISKQNPLSNEEKEINAKLHTKDRKIDQLNKENNLLRNRLSVAENTSTLLWKNHHKHTKKIIDVERNLHKMEKYSWWEWIEIAETPLSIINNLLEEHVLFHLTSPALSLMCS